MRRIAPIGPIAVAVVAVSFLGALTAAARPSEHARIVGAVRAYVATSGCCEVGHTAIADVHVSAVDREYAAVRIDGFDTLGQPIGSVTAVLQRELGAWQVLTLGSSDLGCGVPSAAVRAELDLGCDPSSPAR